MRWLYCRHNPASNLNFGPGPRRRGAVKFFFKLWNTLRVLLQLRHGDGFDPATPPVPVAERPDIDRWLLSDLQLLIKRRRAKPTRATT